MATLRPIPSVYAELELRMWHAHVTDLVRSGDEMALQQQLSVPGARECVRHGTRGKLSLNLGGRNATFIESYLDAGGSFAALERLLDVAPDGLDITDIFSSARGKTDDLTVELVEPFFWAVDRALPDVLDMLMRRLPCVDQQLLHSRALHRTGLERMAGPCGWERSILVLERLLQAGSNCDTGTNVFGESELCHLLSAAVPAPQFERMGDLIRSYHRCGYIHLHRRMHSGQTPLEMALDNGCGFGAVVLLDLGAPVPAVSFPDRDILSRCGRNAAACGMPDAVGPLVEHFMRAELAAARNVSLATRAGRTATL